MNKSYARELDDIEDDLVRLQTQIIARLNNLPVRLDGVTYDEAIVMRQALEACAAELEQVRVMLEGSDGD